MIQVYIYTYIYNIIHHIYIYMSLLLLLLLPLLLLLLLQQQQQLLIDSLLALYLKSYHFKLRCPPGCTEARSDRISNKALIGNFRFASRSCLGVV